MLYFIDNHLRNDLGNVVNDVGLDYAFSRTPRYTPAGTGPNGQAGITLAQYENGARVRFMPDAQTWFRHPTKDRVSFGWWTDDKPGPDFFLRDKQRHLAHEVELADDHKWKIPIALAVSSLEQLEDAAPKLVSVLPCKGKLQRNGLVGPGQVIAKYQWLWEMSEWIFELLNKTGTQTLPKDSHQQAATLLQFFYRVDLPELLELETLTFGDADLLWSIFEAVVDVPTINEWFIKKKLTTKQASHSAPPEPAG